MSMGSAIAGAATSGGQYSDLNSLPSLHYGAGLANMSDPLNLLGHSGSNVGANMTNPFGSGLINGNIPNNGVNPLEAQRWGGTAAPTGLPAAAGPVNPMLPNPAFSYTPLAQGGGPYNAMANGLAQAPAGGGYNGQANTLAQLAAVPTNNPYAYAPGPPIFRPRRMPVTLPQGRLQP